MKKLKINCPSLDELFGGGLESSSITQIYGEAGTGKTNLCLQAARECVRFEGKVAYIDSEGVSLERLRQICTDFKYDDILKKILFFNPSSFEEQEKMIKQAVKLNDVKLVIVDTINMLYRIHMECDSDSVNRSLVRQMADLQFSARKNDLFVLITSQVYTAETGEIKPFAGRGIEHIVKTIVRLDKIGPGKRRATIIKHRSEPEENFSNFTISAVGLQ